MTLTEALSYGVLAGTSIYCFVYTPYHDRALDWAGYGFAASAGLLGILEPDHAWEWIEFSEDYTYPLMVGNLWLDYREQAAVGCAHPMLIVLLRWMFCNEALYYQRHANLTGQMIVAVSCLYLATLKKNTYALAATAVHAFTQLVLWSEEDDTSFPSVELRNCGLTATILIFFHAFKQSEALATA